MQTEIDFLNATNEVTTDSLIENAIETGNLARNLIEAGKSNNPASAEEYAEQLRQFLERLAESAEDLERRRVMIEDGANIHEHLRQRVFAMYDALAGQSCSFVTMVQDLCDGQGIEVPEAFAEDFCDPVDAYCDDMMRRIDMIDLSEPED